MWFFFLPRAQVSICSTISNTEAIRFENSFQELISECLHASIVTGQSIIPIRRDAGEHCWSASRCWCGDGVFSFRWRSGFVRNGGTGSDGDVLAHWQAFF